MACENVTGEFRQHLHFKLGIKVKEMRGISLVKHKG